MTGLRVVGAIALVALITLAGFSFLFYLSSRASKPVTLSKLLRELERAKERLEGELEDLGARGLQIGQIYVDEEKGGLVVMVNERCRKHSEAVMLKKKYLAPIRGIVGYDLPVVFMKLPPRSVSVGDPPASIDELDRAKEELFSNAWIVWPMLGVREAAIDCERGMLLIELEKELTEERIDEIREIVGLNIPLEITETSYWGTSLYVGKPGTKTAEELERAMCKIVESHQQNKTLGLQAVEYRATIDVIDEDAARFDGEEGALLYAGLKEITHERVKTIREIVGYDVPLLIEESEVALDGEPQGYPIEGVLDVEWNGSSWMTCVYSHGKSTLVELDPGLKVVRRVDIEGTVRTVKWLEGEGWLLVGEGFIALLDQELEMLHSGPPFQVSLVLTGEKRGVVLASWSGGLRPFSLFEVTGRQISRLDFGEETDVLSVRVEKEGWAALVMEDERLKEVGPIASGLSCSAKAFPTCASWNGTDWLVLLATGKNTSHWLGLADPLILLASQEECRELEPQVKGPLLLACPGGGKWLLLGARWEVFLLDHQLDMLNISFELHHAVPRICCFNGTHWLVGTWFDEDMGPSFFLDLKGTSQFFEPPDGHAITALEWNGSCWMVGTLKWLYDGLVYPGEDWGLYLLRKGELLEVHVPCTG